MSTPNGPAEEDIDQQFLAELDRAIGHVARASAWLEDAMRALYAAMLGANDAAWLIAAGMSFEQARTACAQVQRSLGWHPQPRRFQAVMNESKTLMDDRNHVVHGVWLKIEGVQPIAFRSRRSRTGQGRYWPVEEIDALAERLSGIGALVQELARG